MIRLFLFIVVFIIISMSSAHAETVTAESSGIVVTMQDAGKTTLSIDFIKENRPSQNSLDTYIIYNPHNFIDYDIVVTLDTIPLTPSEITIKLPAEYLQTIKNPEKLYLFVRTIQDGGMEYIDGFEITDAIYSPETSGFVFDIPHTAAIKNEDTNTYKVFFTIAEIQ